MISRQIGTLLIAQISSELVAHQKDLGIPICVDRQSLTGRAKLVRRRSLGEARHASRIAPRLRRADALRIAAGVPLGEGPGLR